VVQHIEPFKSSHSLYPVKTKKIKGSNMETRREQLQVNPQKCNGCRRCMIACAMKHHGMVNPNLSRVNVLQFEDQDLEVPVI
jgi:Fe-S-cluster-containing dehydrogenase component